MREGVRRAWLTLLALSMPSCGQSPTAGSGSEGMQTFSGVAALGESGGNKVFGAALEAREDGTVQLSVDWTVTAAGTGPNAGNHPPLLASVWKQQFSLGDSGIKTLAQAGGQSSIQLSALVNRGTSYMDVQWNGNCGGCTIEYRIVIRYPPGELRPDAAASCRGWILEPVNVTGADSVYPELELASNPAIARLRLGQKATLGIKGLDCGSNPGFQSLEYSADPSVAVMVPGRYYAELTAVGRGETRPSAMLLSQDGASVNATFAYCSVNGPTNQWCATATPLTLVVH